MIACYPKRERDAVSARRGPTLAGPGVRRSAARPAAAWVVLAVVSAVVIVPVTSHGDLRDGVPAGRPAALNLIIDNDTHIDVNSLDMIVTNHGSFAFNLGAGQAGLFYPRGSNRTVIFASGLWVGARVNGEVRVTVAEHGQEYGPGPIISGQAAADDPRYRVYRIVRGDTSSPDYLSWPVEDGAPVDSLGRPLVLGDMSLWCVYNDADPSLHVSDAGASQPLGIEVHQTTFAFDRPGALGQSLFLKFKVLNKGDNLLEDTYFSLWSDPDVGGAMDDLVGCDPELNLGFCYNATNNDLQYGSTPPAVGYDFLQGPVGDEGQELGMVSFNRYINGTDPFSPDESYNYMLGLNWDGEPVVDPTTGEVTLFADSGDPVNGIGWLDTDPSDRRFMLSSGPFTMAPGDTQEIVAAIIVGQGQDRLTSITALRYNDRFAQAAFDSAFALPSPPPSPQVTLVSLEGEVVIHWDSRSEEEHQEPGYAFEGYNVYQGATASGPFTRIATFDVDNGTGLIMDEVFDANEGVVIEKPVQYGSDSGVRQFMRVTQDAVRGDELRNGTPYYFGVTAYAYNPHGYPRTLENSIQVLEAIPQAPPAGSDLDVVHAPDTASYHQDNSALKPTTDQVTVQVVDPLSVTGHRYRVSFQEVIPDTVMTGSDPELEYPTYAGFPVRFTWSLTDLTTGEATISGQQNKLGDDNYEIADGLQVKVVGAYDPGLTEVVYVDGNSLHPPALGPVNWGATFFDGGVDYAVYFFGSDLDPDVDPTEFGTVELRLGPSQSQKAYCYLRPTYEYVGFFDVPVTAWLVTRGRPDRQLNLCFTENADTSGGSIWAVDSTWTPTAGFDGSREYLFVMASPYAEGGGLYADGIDKPWGPAADVFYGAWFCLVEEGAVMDDGDLVRITWLEPSGANDTFEFSTNPAVLADPQVAQARGDLERVRVVPNPYFNRSAYETDRFHRVLKFTNMPAQCTLRIFNLAGDLLRTLEKNDPSTSLLEWNLLAHGGLPVASGVYIYHVEAPGIGSTLGKFAVFLEEERLDAY